MARSLWRGSLSFGLVNVPVALVSAVRDLDVHFNQLHADTGARLEVKRICKKGGHEVPYEEIGYGYELDSGKHKGKEVVLTQEELDAAQPEKTRTIDIDEFVDVADIDPVFYDHPYFLIPDETGEGPARAYRLLVDAMDRAADLLRRTYDLRSPRRAWAEAAGVSRRRTRSNQSPPAKVLSR